jgi:hypothetical protein
MDILLSVNHVPIIRFPSYGEALAAVSGYLDTGHPVESILLTQLHDAEPTHDERRQRRPSDTTPEGENIQAY